MTKLLSGLWVTASLGALAGRASQQLQLEGDSEKERGSSYASSTSLKHHGDATE